MMMEGSSGGGSGASSPPLLGEVAFRFQDFSGYFLDIDTLLDDIRDACSPKKSWKETTSFLSRKLLALIQKEQSPCFLLPSISHFIDRVQRVCDGFSISSFEWWLNECSGLSDAEQALVRGKIVGRFIPRTEYQVLFPIGMKKRYEGSHIVTAHISPDLDAIVASFWGWIDAFAARVSKKIHYWNVPKFNSHSIVEIEPLFSKVFGSTCFHCLALSQRSLELSALDLLTNEGVSYLTEEQSVNSVEHARRRQALVLLDEKGEYLADWRVLDVETLSRLHSVVEQMLHQVANQIQRTLILIFSGPKQRNEISQMMKQLFSSPLGEYLPQGLSMQTRKQVESYFQVILGLQGGESSIAQVLEALSLVQVPSFKKLNLFLEENSVCKFFSEEGTLVTDPPTLFLYMKEVMSILECAMVELRAHFQKGSIASRIKKEVFLRESRSIPLHTTAKDLCSLGTQYNHFTVDYQNIPLGVIYTQDFNSIGTVSLRDFSSQKEMEIPPYLEVISSIDHHRIGLGTSQVPTLHCGDVQSSNVLLAELTFRMNERYTTSGMSMETIEGQLDDLRCGREDPSLGDKEEREESLLKKRRNAKFLNANPYYVHPQRELLEYTHLLLAILDDTDFLSKVTQRDLYCVKELLNRLKTLIARKEVKALSFHDLPVDDPSFLDKGVQRLMEDPDLVSVHQKVRALKEKQVVDRIQECLEGKLCISDCFSDSKVINICCRVSQFKYFSSNISFLQGSKDKLLQLWSEDCSKKAQHPLHFFLHMWSTMPDMDSGHSSTCLQVQDHQDEIWLWIRPDSYGKRLLRQFVTSFRQGILSRYEDHCSLTLKGSYAPFFLEIFKDNFFKMPVSSQVECGFSACVLKYPAGILNSRKSAIVPHLPKL